MEWQIWYNLGVKGFFKKYGFAVKLVVSAALLAVLYKKLDVAALLHALSNADWRWLLLAYAILVLNTVVSSAKWRVFLVADGVRESFPSLWSSYLIGSFFNLFLPSTIGGDAYRIADIGARTSKPARAAASILADRITGFLALAIYGLVATLTVRHLVPCWRNWFYIPPVAAFAALACASIGICSPTFLNFCCRLIPVAKWRAKARAVAMQITDAMGVYIHRPSVMAKVVILSFVFQLDVVLAVWAITKAVGIDVPFATFFLFVPLKTFIEMIPVSVFGLGLRDLGYTVFMAALLGEASASTNAGIISSVEVILTILYVAIGGVLFVFRKRSLPKAPSSKTNA